MTRDEFLGRLGELLACLPAEQVEETKAFYAEAIADRMEDGMSEEEAVAAMGTPGEVAEATLDDLPAVPRAIARTRRRSTTLLWVLTIVGSPVWVPLLAAFAAVAVNLVVGMIYGGISGYFGGLADNIMMRIVEVINGIPYMIIVVLLMMVLPQGIFTMVIAYATTGWTGMARLVRGQCLSLKNQEFVVASEAMGAKAGRIIGKHLLPNALSVIIINVTLAVPSAIFTEAFLSYIGLGVPVPQPSWGMLAQEGASVFQLYPHQLWIPAIAISLTMLSFNLLGDGLRDAFDPRLRR